MRKIPARKSRFASANLSSIGEAGQRSLARAGVGIAGLGGVGGIAFELLLRAGVGRLKISDSGFFEESNANRQSLWSLENDGQKKTACALAFASSIGSRCKISAFAEITRSSSSQFARGCAAIIDATDTQSSRMAIFSGCKKSGVPYIFASARDHRGMLTVFDGRDFPSEFSLSGAKKHLPCDHALGPVANAIGCIAAQQAINVALKKPLVLFPDILSIDAFSGKIAIVHEF